MQKIALLFIFGVFLISSCQTKQTLHQESDHSSWYQIPTGKPQNLVFASYKTTMIANGEDETLLRISVADSTDREIMNAQLPFKITLKGDAKVTEIDGSSPTLVSETDTMIVWKSQLIDGIKKLRLEAGTTPGKLNIEVSAEGVWSGSHEIHLIPGDIKLMKPTEAQLKPSPNIPLKMIGADISFLPELEARNMVFKDEGVEKNAIEMLKDHGFNYIRLRLFVNPELPEGYSPEQGFCDLDHTLAMAKRIKAAGLHFLLDFHYSDTWADPQKQFKPKAWEGQDFGTLTTSLKNYTKDVLLKMQEQGTLPDMVQVGNEINHGMVWPEGHISNLDNLAELLKAGTSACREVDPDIKVMMHLALGGQNEECVFWLDNMIARDVEFDLIGLSYYPRWHCTLDDLDANMRDLIQRYKKDINVVEYSAFKREVHELVFNLPDNRGNGTAIWEPLNTWSRFIDRDGNTTNEINIYDEMSAKYLK
ncbi:MAG TPA: glycosyl hydrolase 53 family protein [Bacteroidales bacterium]|nr:glycosyl hydrolase 53 family protein [Bacteroidales bacterium]